MTWLWALLLSLFGRAAKLPRGGARFGVRAGALLSIEWLADLIDAYRERGGGEHFLPEDQAYLGRWLDWLERRAFAWAPRASARRLGPRPAGELTLSVFCRRLATTADLLGAPCEPLLIPRGGVRRKLRLRVLRRRPCPTSSAHAPRRLELSG